MPGRLRNARTSEGADDDSSVIDTMPHSRLKFHDPLSWRAGRAIPVAELLRSLKKLADELKLFDQDTLDVTDVAAVAQELAGSHLLAHKDRGVRARAAVCIVDILMLTAPNAPFKGNQLKDIFTTFITSIIPALADPSNAYNQEHIYVLHSLAEYQSIVLLTDIEAADSLILSLFTTCFDIISNSSKASTGEEIVKNVEYDMTRILVTIIDEVPTLPEDVVDTIIVQFLRVDPKTASQIDRKSKKGAQPDGKQDTLGLKEYPPAYNMAKALCSNCPEKMTNHISTYFNNIIVDASDSFQGEGLSKYGVKRAANGEDSGDDTDDLQQLKKAHKLIRELWRACPDVLHNVIPQLEAELGAESVPLRILATETIGDLTAGIGVAGLPPTPQWDPTAWPPLRLGQKEAAVASTPLTTPFAPKPFSYTHTTAYESFLSRRQDRSPSVRTAWIAAISRILLTSAGGHGLDSLEETRLMTGLAIMLSDMEEKVRLAAVDAVGRFGFTDIVNRVAAQGGVSQEGSVLANLAERVKDKRNAVREKAFEILARIWSVAAFEIELSSESVVAALSQIPQHILSAYFTNDAEIQLSIDEVVFNELVPLNFPPIKSDASKTGTQKHKAARVDNDGSNLKTDDPDGIRLRRILTLYRDLDEKGRKIFLHLMQRQGKMTQLMTAYLKTCEDFNGGIVETDEAEVKGRLTKIVDILSRSLPDPSRTSADLWKFAKMHDRRNYQLIRFAMAPESDYRTVTKAIKELTRRVQNGPPGTASLLDTLTPLLHRCSLLFLNRSHIPAVIEISRTDEHGLASSAHEIMKMISSLCPAVLKTHISDMCQDLVTNTPSSNKPEDAGTADTLKACAGFACRFPEEISKDRKLQVALTNYALYSSSPRAAKHAVTILMHTTEKKEMYARDLMSKALKDFSLASTHALARLATISQISLLSPSTADGENEAIADIALNKVLLHAPNSKGTPSKTYVWTDEQSITVTAKEWALKILINRIRSLPETTSENERPKTSLKEFAEPTFRILTLLISNEGELHQSNSTPGSERPRLRLLAAKSILKLCSHKRACEELVTPLVFNSIALVVQDRSRPVRKGFVDQLKKYLTANRLSARWYTVLFVLAFEPDTTLRSSTSLWLKGQSQNIIRSSRVSTSAAGKHSNQNVMELLFARLLSLLAHHPDYPVDKDSENYSADLLDFARYILFYLSSVANEENLSLIFHIAQRVKQTRDGVSQSTKLEEVFSERLYTLSDLSQATIRIYADILSTTKGHEKGVNFLQTWPGKLRLPNNIFKAFDSHQRDLAVTIAEKDFLADCPEVKQELESVVKPYIKPASGSKPSSKKRKAYDAANGDGDESDASTRKKPKKTATKLPIRKASRSSGSSSLPKKRKGEDEKRVHAEHPTRKSTRKSGASVSYIDQDSSDDDREMDDWDAGATTSNDKAKRNSSLRAVGRSSSDPVENGDDIDEMDIDTHTPTGAESKDRPQAPEREENVDADHDDEENEEGSPSPVAPRSKSKKPFAASSSPPSSRRTLKTSNPTNITSPRDTPSKNKSSTSKSKSKTKTNANPATIDKQEDPTDQLSDLESDPNPPTTMKQIAKAHQAKVKSGTAVEDQNLDKDDTSKTGTVGRTTRSLRRR